MEGWCLILFTLSLISASILARMSVELGQSAHANMRSCQMSIPASSMLSQNSSFSNCPPPHRRIILNLPNRAYFFMFSQIVLLVRASDISGGMQLPPRMYTSYPLRLKVKEVPLYVLMVYWMTLIVLMPVLMADWKISCVFRLTSLAERVRRLGCPRSHVHQMLSQMLVVMLKGRLREELVVDLMGSVVSQMDTLLALRFTCRVKLQLANWSRWLRSSPTWQFMLLMALFIQLWVNRRLSILVSLQATTNTYFQMPTDRIRGPQSHPYWYAAFLVKEQFAGRPKPCASLKNCSCCRSCLVLAVKLTTNSLVLLNLTSTSCLRNMLLAERMRWPLRKTSAWVSNPSKTRY